MLYNRKPISRLNLAIYSLPALPLAALSLPLYVMVPAFYTEQLGLSLSVVGITLLLVRLFDAVTDPLIGYYSDRIKFSYGRRRIVFLLSLPITALSALMVFWPPNDAGPLYLAFWICLLSIGNTAAILSYTAWGAEISTDYLERARITAFRETATVIGTLIAIALPFAIGLNTSEGIHGLAALGLFLVFMIPFTGIITLYNVSEPNDYTTHKLGFFDGLIALNQNKPFKRLLTAFLFNGLANAIPATLFLYFVSARIGLEAARGPLLFLYFLCGIIGIPISVWFASRFGKHRSWCIAMILACATFFFSGFLGQGDIKQFIVICVFTGILLGFDLALPPSIQADVIDYDTARTNNQRTGFYFSLWSLATKIALALSVSITLPILDLYGFDPARHDDNTESSLNVLSALYAWMPILPKLIAIGLMWNFPIDKTAQMLTRKNIEESLKNSSL